MLEVDLRPLFESPNAASGGQSVALVSMFGMIYCKGSEFCKAHMEGQGLIRHAHDTLPDRLLRQGPGRIPSTSVLVTTLMMLLILSFRP